MYQFNITKSQQTNLTKQDINNLRPEDFGKYNSDHMVCVDYIDGKWTNLNVLPFEKLALSPMLSALHYGQTIFEGLKAYRQNNNEIATFRLDDHAKRLNTSAERVSIPSIPVKLITQAVNELVKIDAAWVPSAPGSAYYLRPFIFASDVNLIARASLTYKFIVIGCPVGAYYSKALNIKVEEKYTRAADGGTGYAKMGGNYAASFIAANEALKAGFDQVLWTDAVEHGYIHEMGASNIMFYIDNVFIMPSLKEQTVLDSITRRSLVDILISQGKKVVEKKIHIKEIVEASTNKTLHEAFGIGTAATVSPINSITYQQQKYECLDKNFTQANALTNILNDIRYGKIKDNFGWLSVVK